MTDVHADARHVRSTLVVDDDADIRATLTDSLEVEGDISGPSPPLCSSPHPGQPAEC